MTEECAKNHFRLMKDSRSESLDASVCGLVSMCSFSLYGRTEMSIKNAISMTGIFNDWFHSYLTDRVQSTVIGSALCTNISSFRGVPQGSVLSHLLFLFYIKDIYRSSEKLKCYLLYAGNDLQSLERDVNTELCTIYEYLSANKLTLNVKKFSCVIFYPYQKKIDYQITLKIFDNVRSKRIRKIFRCIDRLESYLEITHNSYHLKN